MNCHLCYTGLLLLIHCLVSQGQVITLTPDQDEYTVLESTSPLSICLQISYNDTSDVSFTVDITTNPIENMATVNEDYSLPLSIAVNTTMDSQSCFNVTIVNDTLHEPNEFINIILSSTNMSVSFNGSNIIVEIEDDDPVELEPLPLSSNNITEGNSLQICYSITTGNPNNISLMLSFNVSDIGTNAEEGSDFILAGSAVNGSIVCFNLTAIDDNAFEPLYETISFTVSSSNPLVSVQGGYRTITIIDNEVLSVDLLNTSAVTIMEGQSEQLCFRIFLVESIATSTVFTLDTSSSNGELVAINNVTIAPPEFMIVGCITITAVNDSIPEGEETYTVTWINSDNRTDPVTLTNVVTIVGHLTPSLVNETSVMLTEGQSFMVCVELDGVATKQNNFSYTVINGTASNEDYTPSSGVISIEPGNMIGCSSIQLMGNTEVERTSRNFTISFTDSSIDSMMVTIIDDDVGCVGFSQSMVTLDENVGMYSIELVSACDTITAGFNISVVLDGSGTAIAGRDFNYIEMNPLYWTMSTPPSITVNILNNNIVDGNRIFNLSLSVMAPSGLNISTSISQLQLTIINDDQSTINTPANITYNSTGSNELCFNHTNQLVGDYIIAYSVTDRSVGDDFPLPDGSVSLPSEPSNLACITINITSRDIMSRPTMFKIMWTVDSSDIVLRHIKTTVTLDISFPVTSPPSTTSIFSMPSSTTRPSATPTTTSTSRPILGLGLYPVIGIIVGVVAAGVVCLLLLVCVICCVRVKMNRQGFYVTNEDKGEAPHMLRYSASLRSLQSQTVMPADSREKENEYMV